MKNRTYISTIVVIILIGVALWGELALAQRTTPAATMWDYKIIQATAQTVNNKTTGFSWTEDTKAMETPTDPLIKFKQLGAQGWELMTIHAVGNQTTQYWFKRPR